MRLFDADVRICTGTACFVLGGAELLLLEDELISRWDAFGITAEQIREHIRISGIPCAGSCREQLLRPPFVQIDGTLFGSASLDMIIDILERRVLPKEQEIPGC